MTDIFLSYEVSIHLFIQLIIFFLLSISFYFSIIILKNYQIGASSSIQYSLEKKSYLILTIIQLSLITKIFLLAFFTFTIDSLSTIIPGAMCAAGVINSNQFGVPLILLKISTIILIMLWLVLNNQDLKTKGFIYFKSKLRFFLLIYSLLFAELIIELFYFSSLTTTNPVYCCSNLYKETQENSSLFLDTLSLLISFYTTYVLIMIAAFTKSRYLLSILAIIFLYLSYLAIVYFFSAYIYELPTHKCPYCLLKGEYHYIGYFIYGSLILASFYALSASIYKFHISTFKNSILWYTLFVLILSMQFILYIITNKTFL